MKTQNFPTTPFKLSCGDKPEVRQWLKDNGCMWNDGDDLGTEATDEKYLFVDECCQVTMVDTEGSYYTDHQYPEITPVTSLPKVVGYSVASSTEVGPDRATLKSLQEELTAVVAQMESIQSRIKELVDG